MKKFTFLFTIILLRFATLGQTPQAISYQAVARTIDGNPIIDKQISVKISILSGSASGNLVYSETHSVITNNLGLFTVEIGNPGQVLSGIFEDIAWGTDIYFVKMEMDENGGSNYQLMGTSQLLAVPYALYSENTANPEDADANPGNELQTLSQNGNNITLSDGGGTISVADNDNMPANELQTLSGQDYEISLSQGGGTFITGVKSFTQAEIDTMEPYNGLTVHNATTNCINYYFNNNWFESCGTCTPLSSQADAGQDQSFYDFTTTANLSANTPGKGNGLWTVVSGTGGSFENAILPETIFTGQPCNFYTLAWTISTPCDSTTDQVDIIFFAMPTTAFAGDDITIYNGDLSVNLNANSPETGQGQWSILNGTGGTFNDANNPATLFTGLSHVDYTLQWTISTACASSSDEVDIAFKPCLPFTDPRDGQNYTTVLIGEQCWMQKNLNYSTGNSWCYSNNSAFCDLVGRLYSWDAAINACPAGWHLPSDTEWCILEQEVDPTITCNATFYRGMDGGTKLKVNGSSGFWAYLAGVRNTDATFAGMNAHGYFWTSSTYGAKSWYRSLWDDSPQVYRMDHERVLGFSVRCLQSENPNQPPEPPSSPNPENGEADQSTLSTLSWTCSDPDNDPLTYDVYFGSEATPPQLASGQAETTFNPGILDINTAYFWKIVAHDDHLNVSEGPVWSFTTDDGVWDCGELFQDSRDNQIYESVQIGSQCWMAENLNIGVMVNMGSGQPNNEIIEKYCHANNNADCDTYGGLYEYWEMILHTSPSVDICPEGWHVPIVDEWCILENYVDAGTISSSECYAAGTFGTDAGGNLKETGTSHWLSPNAGATNSSGFTALGSGSTYNNNSISMIKVDARFWAKDWAVGTTIHSRGLHYNTARIKHSHVDPYSSANGVRCIKD